MAKKTTTGKTSARKTSPRKRKKGRKKPREIRISLWVIIGVLVVLTGLVSLPYLKERKPSETGAPIPVGAYCYGIDISHYQHEVEWDSLMVLTDSKGRTIQSMKYARDIRPVSYVFIKATEGNSMKDKKFRKHWKEAGKRDIRRGAYHFFRSSKDPLVQAELFIRTVGDLRYKDLPPVLDIETIHRGCSVKELNEKALKWLKAVEEHYDRKPIVYSGASFMEDILCDEIKDNYPIWVAHYQTDLPRCGNWHFWQFTDKALVHGVKGYSDLSVCHESVLKKM